MKIAITGASGELGGALVRRLVADREASGVVALDARPPVMTSGKIVSFQLDLSRQDLRPCLEGCDSLVHLAPLDSEASGRVFLVAGQCGVRHMILVSSAAVYDASPQRETPLDEDAPRGAGGDSSRIAALCALENFLDQFERQSPNLALARFRPVTILDPHMANPIEDLRGREAFPVQAVWVSDVADALVLALKKRAAGAFNLGAADPLCIDQIVQETGCHSAAPAKPPRGGSSPLDWHPVAHVSSQRAYRELAWKPRCPTVASVFQTYLALAPRSPDKRVAWFLRIANWSGAYGPKSPELQGVKISIQLELTGPGGATYGIVVNDGRLSIRREKLDAPGSIVTLKASLFRKILAGKTSWSKEQLTGRIQAIGQGHAPMVITGIVATFRSNMGKGGIPGALVRLLARWIEAGA